jgi:hypothetical protein
MPAELTECTRLRDESGVEMFSCQHLTLPPTERIIFLIVLASSAMLFFLFFLFESLSDVAES